MLLLMKLESIEHARFRALAQITIDKDKGVEAFEEYMKIAFPYMEAAKTKDRETAKQQLENWIKRGAFSVTSLAQPRMRSKLKTRVLSRRVPKTAQEAEELYKKMGQSIPIR